MGLFPPEQEGDNEHYLSGVVLPGLSAFQAKTVALFAPVDTGSLSVTSIVPRMLCLGADKAAISADK